MATKASRGQLNLALFIIMFMSWIALTICMSEEGLFESRRADFSRDTRERPVAGSVAIRTKFTWNRIINVYYNVEYNNHRMRTDAMATCASTADLFITSVVFAWLGCVASLATQFLRLIGKVGVCPRVATSHQGLSLELGICIWNTVWMTSAVLTNMFGCFIWEATSDDIYTDFRPTSIIFVWLCWFGLFYSCYALWQIKLMTPLTSTYNSSSSKGASSPVSAAAPAANQYTGVTSPHDVAISVSTTPSAPSLPPRRPQQATSHHEQEMTSTAAPSLPPRKHAAPAPAPAPSVPSLPPRRPVSGGSSAAPKAPAAPPGRALPTRAPPSGRAVPKRPAPVRRGA